MASEVSQNIFSKISSGSIECKIDLIMYEDEEIHYVYSPALNLIGYGRKSEAFESWEVVIEEYLKYGTQENTLIKDLENYGWNIKKNQASFQPPTLSWLLKNNVELSEMYDKHNFHKTAQLIAIPLQSTFA